MANAKSEQFDIFCRVAYPHFLKKRDTFQGQPVAHPKHEALLIIKKDPAGYQADAAYQDISGKIGQTAVAQWGSWLPELAMPVEDGDADLAKLAKYPWRAEHWVMKVKNYDYVALADANANAITEEFANGKPTCPSGAQGIAKLEIRTSEAGGTKRISLIIIGFKVTGEGEAIGSSGPPSVADVWGQPTGPAATAQQVAPAPLSQGVASAPIQAQHMAAPAPVAVQQMATPMAYAQPAPVAAQQMAPPAMAPAPTAYPSNPPVAPGGMAPPPVAQMAPPPVAQMAAPVGAPPAPHMPPMPTGYPPAVG